MEMNINNDTYINPNLYKYLNSLPKDLEDIKIIPHIIDLEAYFKSIIDPIIINKIPLKSKYSQDIINYINLIDESNNDLLSCKRGKLRDK